MPSRQSVFQFDIFKCCREPVQVYVHLSAFSNCRNSVSMLCFCYDLSVPIFCSKIFLPLSHPVVDMASPILPLIAGRFFFVVLERSVLSILFGLVSVSFSLHSFASIFWLVSSSFFCSSSCRAFSVSSEYFLMFRFSILACCRSFVVSDSSLSSHLGFDFFLWSSRRPRFFHRLIVLLRILNHLTTWCRLSGYLSKSRSLSRFQTWLSSSLGF